MTHAFHSGVDSPSSARRGSAAAELLQGNSKQVSINSRPAQHPARTVLVLSTDDVLRPMLRAFLEHLGFSVISCTETRRAVHILSHRQGDALLIIDTHPGSPDVELEAELGHALAHTPVVILAGEEPHQPKRHTVADHEWTLLTKPLRLQELLATIQRAFERNDNRVSTKSIPPDPRRGPASGINAAPSKHCGPHPEFTRGVRKG